MEIAPLELAFFKSTLIPARFFELAVFEGTAREFNPEDIIFTEGMIFVNLLQVI
jgi:hypothetical protein